MWKVILTLLPKDKLQFIWGKDHRKEVARHTVHVCSREIGVRGRVVMRSGVSQITTDVIPMITHVCTCGMVVIACLDRAVYLVLVPDRSTEGKSTLWT